MTLTTTTLQKPPGLAQRIAELRREYIRVGITLGDKPGAGRWKPVIVGGKEYPSLAHAGRALGKSSVGMRYALRRGFVTVNGKRLDVREGAV